MRKFELHRVRRHLPGRYLLLICSLVLATGCQVPEEQHYAAPEDIPTPESTVVPGDSTTAALFDGLMAEARAASWHDRPLGEIMEEVGRWFGGKPYVAGTLDAPAYEYLVVKLDGFDCVTFVESVTALARTIKAQSYLYGAFEDHLRAQRYRDGEIDGYCSRLHYFSEWILDNEKRGLVKNISADLGGVVLEKQLNFMTRHRDSYAHLKNDSLFTGIAQVEQSLKSLKIYHVPQEEIASVYPALQAGDIVALATDIEGLDVVHTGLVFKHGNGNAGLLHASTANGVIVSPDLQAYVENNKRQVGIVVARVRGISNF